MSIEIEYDLTGATPDYSMFTELGNAAVHAVVTAARANNLTWAETYRALYELSEQEPFGEAMDTEVREIVYSRLGYKDEPFYL